MIKSNCIWITAPPAVRYRRTWWAHQPCYCLSELKPVGSDRTPWHLLMQTGTPCGRDNVEQILPQLLEAEEREHHRLNPNISQLLKRYLGYDTDISVKKKKEECVGDCFPPHHHCWRLKAVFCLCLFISLHYLDSAEMAPDWLEIVFSSMPRCPRPRCLWGTFRPPSQEFVTLCTVMLRCM